MTVATAKVVSYLLIVVFAIGGLIELRHARFEPPADTAEYAECVATLDPTYAERNPVGIKAICYNLKRR